MSNPGAKGYHDGREGRPYREPHDTMAHLLKFSPEVGDRRGYEEGRNGGASDRMGIESSPSESDQSQNAALSRSGEEASRGSATEWKDVAGSLKEYRSVRTIAHKLGLSEAEAKKLLESHSDEVRRSMVNSPEGDELYIRRDTGLRSWLRELLAIAQLAAR
jgi:hypothetical protein